MELTPLGATLSTRRPGSLRDVALYWMETHCLPFSEMLHTVRTGDPAAQRSFGKPFFDWIVADPARAELQNRGMAGLVGGMRDRMFAGYRLPEGEVVADIGGADGTVLTRLLACEPARRGILFDLPEILPSARKTIEEAGMADRVDVVAGDFFESVPSADVYVLAAILHDWDHASCATSRAPGAAVFPVDSRMRTPHAREGARPLPRRPRSSATTSPTSWRRTL
ncbi:methyltransferase [Streptomyces sp. NPDC054794]